MRIGVGYDLHQLVRGRPLILGGVTIPFDRGLLGHSDGDALAHAIIDALLGGGALGNIGTHFPDTNAAFKDADSMDLLRRTAGLLRENGFGFENVDATIVAERPKLNPYVEAMRESIGGALSLAVDRISVKAKTNEGVGPEGRGEAISVHAVALLNGG